MKLYLPLYHCKVIFFYLFFLSILPISCSLFISEELVVKEAFLPGRGGGVGLLAAASSTLRGSTLCLRFNRNFLVFFLVWSTAPD